MPGVEKSNVSIQAEAGALNVEGRLELGKYQGLVPFYTEYNVGRYSRRASGFPARSIRAKLPLR